MTTQPALVEYDKLMQANLNRVFGERDPGKRLVAIRELYLEDATMNEPHAAFTGHAAINDAVTALLKNMPPEFEFRALGPAIGHHGIGRLKWQSGPPKGAAAVTGMDIAHFANNRIHSLFVFLES